MSLELPDADDRDRRLTRAEMWRGVLFALGGALIFVVIGAAELLLMQ